MRYGWLTLLLMLTPVSAGAATRIVSTGICVDQWVLALAPREQIAGISRNAAREDISAYAQEAAGIPIHNGSAEQIVALKPDLVIADAYTRKAVLQTLQRLDIPVVKVPQAIKLEEWQPMLKQVGEALGQQKKAQAIAGEMGRDWRKLQASPLPSQPLVAIYRPGGYSPGTATLADDALAHIGVRNLSSQLGYASTRALPLEALIANEPQFLIEDISPKKHTTLASLMMQHRALQAAANHAHRIEYPLSAWFCLSPRSLPAVLALREEIRKAL